MKRRITAVVLAGALATPMFAGTALADHGHNLITPGKTVEDIANGQTGKSASDPGGHKFHVNVHLGTPGTFAFQQPNNPNCVEKTVGPSCTP